GSHEPEHPDHGPWRDRDRGEKEIGDDVHSHRVAPAVPSARRGLTSEFGMGSGGSPAPWPPIKRSVEGCVSSGGARVQVEPRMSHVRYGTNPWTGVLRCRSDADAIRSGQAARALSTARLHVLPRFHLSSINVVVSHGPSGVFRPGRIHLG